ncbi:putative indole-3-acetic acid-amido synthetase GH3.6 [Iris pallida]|uniref:Indole-3-acetic acid-amido synthetase GH3.6 n=1 Tax=Iris pallida TaxID=29817 RepID=A0AAX6I796_IRIPA|nr:putative indole-3-acetic acid-amido synthetase GH3.6 [Iris pallida]
MALSDEQVLQTIEESTINARALQLQTLRSILSRNSAATFLRHHRQPTDADSFRRLVPLSSYEDYADTIQKMADGELPAASLSLDPLLCFFNSSGTGTMKPKLIPFFNSAPARESSSLAHQASSALLRRLFPPRPSVNKILWFLYAGNVTETKGGFKVMAASAFPFHFKGPSPSPFLSVSVSPPEVILGSATEDQTFCHLLCGLRNADAIDAIRAPYAAGLVRAFRLLRSEWQRLCGCIENGSVSPDVTDLAMRGAVDASLGAPRADLAERIREVCGRGDWRGILKELWPELRYIACVTTGSMEQYYPILKYYAGESVPLLCGDYFASECSIGINLDRIRPPSETSFVILPTAAYFEFLPFELGAPAAEETVDISGVEAGKTYEVVVTTYRGLYRYRLGDVVRVVGFHNASPRVEFVTRAPKADSEAFTERDLASAAEGLKQVLRDGRRGEVVEYAGFLGEDHWMFFLEVDEQSYILKTERLEESVAVLRRCCSVVEECMGSVYRRKREIGEVGPVEMCVVKPGSFEDMARMALESGGASSSQYKPPKILRNRRLVDSLMASVVVAVSLGGDAAADCQTFDSRPPSGPLV